MNENRNAISQCIAILITLLAAIWGSTSQASEFEFERGHWLGKSEWSSSGRFESCMISVHNAKNEVLIFRIDRTRDLTLGFFEKDWGATGFKLLNVILMVDHSILHSGIAFLREPDAMIVKSTHPDKTLNRVSEGQLLQITTRDQSMIFSLKGASDAVKYLRGCFKKGLGSFGNI